MRSLHLLNINSCDLLQHLPLGIKELTNLRILSQFLVGNKIGAQLGELKDLNTLEGELEITPLENVGGFHEAKTANLKYKTNLSVLKLSWSSIYMREGKRETFIYDEQVLEGLEPNPSLKELRISFYMGNTISPSWMVNLQNLIKFEFFGCKECKHIPSLGSLRNLKVVKLLGMDSLERFHDQKIKKSVDNTYMFLSLQELNIIMCPNLISLPSKLPKLKVLKLEGCGALISLPAEIQSFKDMTELEIRECKHVSKWCKKSWPKVFHIPKIRIDSSGNIRLLDL